MTRVPLAHNLKANNFPLLGVETKVRLTYGSEFLRSQEENGHK